MKYSEINNIEELEAARRGLSAEVDRKGREVLSRWEDVRDAYSVTGLLATGLKHISTRIPFDRIVLYGIRALKRRLF